MFKSWAGRLALFAVGGLLALCVWAGAQPPAAGDASTVQGRVERFTTAPKGEVDGAVLDDGTVLHWPPHLQDRFTGIIAKGDRVKASGRMETGPEGDTHLEVQTVTNLRTGASRDNDAGPPPPPPGARPGGPEERPRVRLADPFGAAESRARPGDPEERLRALEDRVDRLAREIERLQRDR
jgi:hypothetical protein